MCVEIAVQVLAAMRAHADAALPEEACGILLGESARITAAIATRNAHPTPHTHFEIDPQALIAAHRAARAGGPAVVGYYHSHPRGPAVPSATDRASAAGDGKVWVILAPCDSGADVAFWRDGEQGFAALPFAVSDG